MRHFKFLTLLLLFLSIGCSTDDDQIMENTSPTIEPAGNTFNSKNNQTTINTSNRIIIGQLFSGINYTGQVHTISLPKNWNGKPLVLNIGYVVRSAAFVNGIEFRRRIGGRFVVSKNHVQYMPNVNWPVRELRNSIVFVDKPLEFKRYDGVYAGQLFSTNNSSQIPVWGNLDLGHPVVRSIFNDKVKAFIPASQTSRGMVALRADASINSHMISLLGIKDGHVHDPKIRTLHPVVQRTASYLQVTNGLPSQDLFNFLSWHPHKTGVDKALDQNFERGKEISHCFYNHTFLGFANNGPGAAFVQATRCGVEPVIDHFAGEAKLYTNISGLEQETRSTLKRELLDEMGDLELQKIKDKLEKITGKSYRWNQLNIRYYGNGTFVI